jgi:hypothetical protein
MGSADEGGQPSLPESTSQERPEELIYEASGTPEFEETIDGAFPLVELASQMLAR